MTTSVCRSIVRIGGQHDSDPTGIPLSSGTPSDLLQKALFQYFEVKGNVTDETPPSETKNEKTTNDLTISNRYFSATVSLLPIGNDSPSGDVSLNQKEDSIILVFWDANNNGKGAFDGLQAVHDTAEAAGGGDLLRLCVALVVRDDNQGDANTSTNLSTDDTSAELNYDKAYEEEYARRIMWCLDRGYEYVEVPVQVLLDDDALLNQGHDERDKEGFARVVEAVAGTVWSSAVMKAKKRTELKQSYDEVRQSTTTDKPSSATSPLIATSSFVGSEEDTTSQDAYVPPDPSLLTESLPTPPSLDNDADLVAREEMARTAVLKQSELIDPPEREYQSLGSTDGPSSSGGENPPSSEHLMEQMESVIRQAGQIREISRSGTMTDDERRKRAGDAAMLLLNLMDQMGFDGEDEEDGQDDMEEMEGVPVEARAGQDA